MADALASLQAMFPEADAASLEEVLAMVNNDVALATNFLLGDAEAAAAGGAAAAGAGHANEEEEEEEEEDEDGEGGVDEEEEDGDEDEEEEDEEDEPVLPHPPAKKLRMVVEPSDPAKHAGEKTHFARFDGTILKKTYIELLNLMPSKLSHSSITIWAQDVLNEAAGKALLEAKASSGWWVSHFPVSEVDHVWRVLVNAHLKSKAFGPVVHVVSQSFSPTSHGDLLVCALVPDLEAMSELRRIGVSLLSIAPSASAKQYVLFLKGALKEISRDPSSGSGSQHPNASMEAGARVPSSAKVEEKAEYKLAREKRSDKEKEELAAMAGTSLGKRPGRPFGVIDPDRAFHQLYCIEKTGSPVNWVKVEAKD